MHPITVIYLFGTIGIIDTLYLIFHTIRKTDVKCPLFPKEWCRTVQYSSYSRTLGIPNSVAGFVMYAAILVLASLYTSGSIALWPLVAVITLGFLFSLYFTYIQAFVLKTFCTWCVVSAINFIVLTVTVWFFF